MTLYKAIRTKGTNNKKEKGEMKKGIRICVLHRGWVLVGEYSRKGEYVTLNKPSVIRVWGADKGLGQLAAEGPSSKTVLDPEPECEFHACQVIRTIMCDAKKWAGHLK